LLIGGFFVVIAAWFVIVFTGRLPRGTFGYGQGVLPMGAAGGCLRLRRWSPTNTRPLMWAPESGYN
jgi:hypothetical protein